MALEKLACQVHAEQKGRRLDHFLAQVFAERLSRRKLRRLIETGAVYIDGKRVRVASRKVHAGAQIEIYLEEGPPAPLIRIDPSLVLFEDEYLIAIDKPSGLAAQATLTDAVNDLFSQVRRLLIKRQTSSAGQKPPSRPPYLALHHRLDRGTSGVMLFAKERQVNRGLTLAFSEHRIRKIYHALTALTASAAPTGAWTVRNRLCPPREAPGGPRRVLEAESEADSRPAETEFRPLRCFPRAGLPGAGLPGAGLPGAGLPGAGLPGAAWVEATPKTGRTHQIRVHLADSGLPVLGDRLYGRDAAALIPAPRLMLHALSLTLEHPVTGEALCIESPLPEDFRRQVEVLEY